MKFIKDLKGFSGCKIKLYSSNGNYFVRKISRSVSYNERFKQQINKQKYFLNNLATNNISTPKVLEEGHLDDLYYFDMEYIHGVSLIDHIYEAKISDLKEISSNIESMLRMMKNSTKQELIDFSHIDRKVEDIMNHLINNKIGVGKDTISDLKIMINNMEKPNDIKKTFCHGDLTMENIMYDKKKDMYFLIDFLDSFIEHYWFDITNLFQDIEGQWYKFRNPKINIHNMTPKMNFVNNFLRERVLNEEDLYLKYHYILLALKFSRILPYAQEADMKYLTSTIRRNMELAK
jgi:thiamine kinase-like enzyme